MADDNHVNREDDKKFNPFGDLFGALKKSVVNAFHDAFKDVDLTEFKQTLASIGENLAQKIDHIPDETPEEKQLAEETIKEKMDVFIQKTYDLFNHDLLAKKRRSVKETVKREILSELENTDGFELEVVLRGETKNDGYAIICKAYTGDDEEVYVPEGVTTIGARAFENADQVQAVVLPVTLKRIKNYAFNHCASLKKVQMFDTVINIGDYAFNDCVSLTDMHLPDSVVSLGKGVFCGCTGLKTIRLSGGIKSLPAYTFANCSSLEAIYHLPEFMMLQRGGRDYFDEKCFFEAYGLDRTEQWFYDYDSDAVYRIPMDVRRLDTQFQFRGRWPATVLGKKCLTALINKIYFNGKYEPLDSYSNQKRIDLVLTSMDLVYMITHTKNEIEDLYVDKDGDYYLLNTLYTLESCIMDAFKYDKARQASDWVHDVLYKVMCACSYSGDLLKKRDDEILIHVMRMLGIDLDSHDGVRSEDFNRLVPGMTVDGSDDSESSPDTYAYERIKKAFYRYLGVDISTDRYSPNISHEVSLIPLDCSYWDFVSVMEKLLRGRNRDLRKYRIQMPETDNLSFEDRLKFWSHGMCLSESGEDALGVLYLCHAEKHKHAPKTYHAALSLISKQQAEAVYRTLDIFFDTDSVNYYYDGERFINDNHAR